MARTRIPLITRLKPQLISEVSIENSATSTTALRGVRGMRASHTIIACTGGEEATTYPPMMINAICMVSGIKLQKPSPKYFTRSRDAEPVARPATKTIATPISAKMNASGNHRCDQSAMAMPTRTKRPSAVSSGAPTVPCFSVGMRVTPFRRQAVAKCCGSIVHPPGSD